ncbi:MAG: glutathione S-transferase family protein [Anaerolineae bacterium]
MYTLYIGNKNYSSWSLRPWVLLSELEIPFEEKLIPFKGQSNWDSYRAFSPNGKVPCLTDGDVTVWDSMAIMEYVAEDHAQVWAAGRAARAWGRCVAAEMHSGFGSLRTMCGMTVGLRVELNEVTDGLKKDVARIDELWSEGISRFGGPFLTGTTFTAADAFYAPVVFRAQTYGLQLSQISSDYCQHILGLKSMQAWATSALAETWRDVGAEEAVKSFGRITEDNRAT